jgi:hypothetical protein
MQARDLELQYQLDNDDLVTEAAKQQSSGKQYRARRSFKASRRRVPKASHPGYGVSGRRHRRWTW